MTLALPLHLDDADAMAVLADWLAERGDVRGELVQLQLARESAPFDARLAQAETRHLALHAKALLGPVALHQSVCELRWRRGFVVAATLRSESREEGWVRERVEPVNRLERAVRALTRLPRAEALVDLTLEQPWSWFVARHVADAARGLRGCGLPLRRLVVRTPWLDDDARRAWNRWSDEPEPGLAELEHDGLRVVADERVAGLVQRALWD